MKIFISYSRRDARDFAEKISETLGDEHSIFTDINDIQLGDVWSNTIEDNIASCDIFLVIVTFAALKSPEVEKEVLQAQNKNKKIIPCFYGRVKRNELKWGLGDLQGIEFANENQLAREINWKIYQYQNKVQPKLDATIQATVEPAIESKQESVKETEVIKAEEIKPEVIKAEEIKSEVIKTEETKPISQPPVSSSHGSLPKPEKKSSQITSKRTVLLIIMAIGAIITGIIAVYVSNYLPQPGEIDVTPPSEPTETPSEPTTSLEQQQYSFVIGWGSLGSGDGQFNSPAGVAVTPSGDVYVADTNNNRIQKFTDAGNFITKWGYEGSGDGQFSSPAGVAVAPSGDVYVADTNNNRIQKFTSDGEFITRWGSTGLDDGQFSSPDGVAVAPSGDVYVTDSVNNRTQKFTSDGEFITRWGSEGSGDGQFSSPAGVAVAPSGDVYVTDFVNDRIQKFTSDGEFITKWGLRVGVGIFSSPHSIAVDSSGDVFVTDTGKPNRIQKFTSDGEFITRWGSTGSGGIAVDSSGDVFVIGTYTNRIQVFRQGTE